MDFAVLPPEVNSARMYAGSGSTPMLAAAAAWDRLAATLTSTASSYQTVLEELTDGGWQGPSASAMFAAAQPYLSWLGSTAGQAAATAGRARTVAALYEAAHAATVPPAVVAANRAQLANLTQSNVLGQNTAAIAANQADYAQMWATDATAMQTYAAGSAAAAPDLSALTAAPQTTSAAAGQAAASPGPLTQLAQLIVANPTISSVTQLLGTLETYEGLLIGADAYQFIQYMLFVPAVVGAETAAKGFAQTFMAAGGYGPIAGLTSTVHPGAGFAGLTSPGAVMASSALPGASLPGLTGSAASGASSTLGRAVQVGGLSAPSAWGNTVDRLRPVAALGAGGTAGMPVAGVSAPGGMLGALPPVAGMVNAPSGDRPGAAGRSDVKVIPAIARAAADPDTENRRRAVADGRRTAHEELRRLRESAAQLNQEREALEKSADSLLRLAGLHPSTART